MDKKVIATPRRPSALDRSYFVNSLLEFAQIVGSLKAVRRKGWRRGDVPKCESVADHSWRMALLSLLLVGDIQSQAEQSKKEDNTSSKKIDVNKCIQMALVHDLAEAVTGDITPHDGTSKQEKQKMEKEAMEAIANTILGCPILSQHFLNLFHEYERRESDEAKAVKDLSMLDVILQADEYERCYPDATMDEFFLNTPVSQFRTPLLKEMAEQVHQQRQDRINYTKKKPAKSIFGKLKQAADSSSSGQGKSKQAAAESSEGQEKKKPAKNIFGRLKRPASASNQEKTTDAAFVSEYAKANDMTEEQVEQVVKALRAWDTNGSNKMKPT